MANTITDEGRVFLGTTEYPIVGQVRRQLLSRFPGKMVTGDYQYANEQFLSNLIWSDTRGGILVEEMDESIHAQRTYWATTDLRFKGHEPLPPLATTRLICKHTLPTSATGWANPNNTFDDDITTGATVVLNATAWSPDYLEVTVASKTINHVLVYISVPNHSADDDEINVDYYDGSWHDLYDDTFTNDQWNGFSLGSNVTTVTKIRVKVYNHAGAAETFSVMEIGFGEDTTFDTAQPIVYENYNGHMYIGNKITLYREDDDGDGVYPVKDDFDANITAVVKSVASALYIVQGDSDNYYHMTTAEVFTQKDQAGTLAIHWNSALYVMDSAGAMYYSDDPEAVDPTWTTDADLADVGVSDNEVISLEVAPDASDNQIIYAGTIAGLFAHDSTNNVWIETHVKLPDHPNGAKGMLRWRKYLYISAGLDVIAYRAATSAVIDSVGLNEDDGLPFEQQGEIMKLIEGYNAMYALVDASQSTGTGYSSVMAYDGKGWQCLWTTTTADKIMKGGIASSAASAYQLWFDHNGTLITIPLNRSLRNPLKISTSPYAASAINLRPWFDAGTQVFPKLATKLTIYSIHPTTDETVTFTYRLNHGNTDRDTGWLTLGSAITATAKTEIPFGTSGVGIVFQSIQIKEALARGSTTTNTPDILAVVLSYMKLLDLVWGWVFTIDCAEAEKVGKEPRDLEAALMTDAETETLLEFTFRNDASGGETHYVKIHPLNGITPTGENFEGRYTVSVIEP